MALVVEFTVEPFTEGAPGPHVQAAVAAANELGLDVDFGPFGSTVEGDDAHVLDAVDRILRAAMGAGASRISVQITNGKDRKP
ncbi:MAG: thiamine-binding protein [Acidimicrobiales bacterium]